MKKKRMDGSPAIPFPSPSLTSFHLSSSIRLFTLQSILIFFLDVRFLLFPLIPFVALPPSRPLPPSSFLLSSSFRDHSSTQDPLDPTAEPSSGLESPSNRLRQWTIGPVRATSHGSVTPRRDDRVEPVLVLRWARWIPLLLTDD